MALPTAVGLVAFGCGLLARSWWMLPGNRAEIPLWIPATICFTGLIVDLYTPLGVANGILYVPLVLTALWFGNRNAPILFAFVCTVLLLLGFFAVNHGENEYWREAANRSITAATLWLVAIFVFYFMRNSQHLETERIRFSALVRNTPDAVIAIDEIGRITSFNPAAESMFGYTPQEAIGNNIKMLMPEPYHSEHDTYLGNYRRTGEERIIGTTRMVSGRRKNGVVFPIDLSVSAVVTGSSKTFVGIVRDISERVRQEERMKTTLAQLEAYTADLERSNHDLDEFAYIAACTITRVSCWKITKTSSTKTACAGSTGWSGSASAWKSSSTIFSISRASAASSLPSNAPISARSFAMSLPRWSFSWRSGMQRSSSTGCCPRSCATLRA
jgi:PAS domain S-box-containing protein